MPHGPGRAKQPVGQVLVDFYFLQILYDIVDMFWNVQNFESRAQCSKFMLIPRSQADNFSSGPGNSRGFSLVLIFIITTRYIFNGGLKTSSDEIRTLSGQVKKFGYVVPCFHKSRKNLWNPSFTLLLNNPHINSLAPGRCWCNRCVIFSEVMAWFHQATSHYLKQCWPNSRMPYGVTRANELRIDFYDVWQECMILARMF